MKRIILQHWSGAPTEVERRSWASIAAYAKRVHAEHAVLMGMQIGKTAFPHMQKLHLFSKAFDAYDTVVMMDSDMFARAGAASIFDTTGIGVVGDLQRLLRKQVRRFLPEVFSDKGKGDYYGGALYRFDRAERELMRPHMTRGILRAFDKYEAKLDEGVVHYLASVTRTVGRQLPDGEMWACSSFDPAVGRANLIHIRRRIAAGQEERRAKIQNLDALVNCGVLPA